MTKLKYVIEVKYMVVDNKNKKTCREYHKLYVTDKLGQLINYAEQKLGIKVER